jgi:hypothetical protein
MIRAKAGRSTGRRSGTTAADYFKDEGVYTPVVKRVGVVGALLAILLLLRFGVPRVVYTSLAGGKHFRQNAE